MYIRLPNFNLSSFFNFILIAIYIINIQIKFTQLPSLLFHIRGAHTKSGQFTSLHNHLIPRKSTNTKKTLQSKPRALYCFICDTIRGGTVEFANKKNHVSLTNSSSGFKAKRAQFLRIFFLLRLLLAFV